MNDLSFNRRRALAGAAGIAALYLFGSLAWILLSDAAVVALARDAEELSRWQNYKGMGFVAVMSLLLGVLIYRLIRARAEEARANALMTTDHLTRLPNLLAFTESLSLHVRRKQPFALMLLDAKGFAGINVSLGRESGDQVLMTLAGRVRGLLGREQVAARLQADRFGIIAPSPDGLAPLVTAARSRIDNLGNDIRVDHSTVQLDLTAGVCEFPRDGDTVARLMDAAELALNQTRVPGEQALLCYEAAMQQTRTEHFLMEIELREALRYRQLTLHFQPQFDLATGVLTGAEALVRWFHAEHGAISPSRFIPVAEASGLIDQLTEFVFDESCRQIRLWLDEGFDVVPVSINIAGHRVGDVQLGVYLREAASRHGVPFQWLQVEVTESMAVHDANRGAELLNALRKVGVTIALDDFGTGYSSLKYLLELPIDVLKVDRSFIAGITGDAQRARFVKVIVDLARDLGLSIVAEGVETEDQRRVLFDLGCHIGQGYLFSPPVEAAEFRRWLEGNVPPALTPVHGPQEHVRSDG